MCYALFWDLVSSIQLTKVKNRPDSHKLHIFVVALHFQIVSQSIMFFQIIENGTLCFRRGGSVGSDYFVSASDYITVVFSADFSTTGKGFNASYYCKFSTTTVNNEAFTL